MKIKVRMKNDKHAIAHNDDWTLIYDDGNFSSRGVSVFVTPKRKLIAVPWSKWQGEDPEPHEIDVNEFLHFPHSGRVLNALEKADFKLDVEEI